MFVILRNPRSTDRSLWFFADDLDQLCMKNAAADRIEDQLFSTEKVYRRVCILQKEYEAKLMITEWAEYRQSFFR
ncbi:hypothetical protein T01_5329 [Trichinella spiralis]|uniref:Uncharacterized protein n=1 Tax=Trichinella spiralis TaxID=6334 RepID=A0A0V1C1H4_TRISP|nr:hypothetical protein T01_5329 [Trichinella spiralis]